MTFSAYQVSQLHDSAVWYVNIRFRIQGQFYYKGCRWQISRNSGSMELSYRVHTYIFVLFKQLVNRILSRVLQVRMLVYLEKVTAYSRVQKLYPTEDMNFRFKFWWIIYTKHHRLPCSMINLFNCIYLLSYESKEAYD